MNTCESSRAVPLSSIWRITRSGNGRAVVVPGEPGALLSTPLDRNVAHPEPGERGDAR